MQAANGSLPRALPAKKQPPKPQLAKKPPPQKQAPQQQSWFTRTTNAAASGIGNFGNAVVSAVGNGVSGAGKGAGASITNSSRTWGETVREYGNSIKDATGAGGPRGVSSTNPLGLASTASGAKAIMSSKPGPTPRKGTANNPLGL
ncbi:hypothetical protein DM02DRAFT_608286 [Periconia macrospinosa]|uniref:Uncharacterized protein n=1 Tax=Periconia macrospinosa TaxID=97972 RepID=A0A2V1EES7_9PLEO|nr:hypothetical protein DM02DRAFT_608286 [Periconia macrospinosa]